MWCVADLDDTYIARMEDVLAVYERPYSAAEPVVCVDEKPVSLHAEVRTPQPASPGHIAKRDNEYRRQGVANIFAVVEPKAGKHLSRVTPDRSALQFALTIQDLVLAYPFARTIHLVMDNLNTHCRKSLIDHLGEQEGGYIWNRLTVHHTPKHGSWLNQAEIELSLISRQCLGKRRIPTVESLNTEVKRWTKDANRRTLRINWHFTRKSARKTFAYIKNISRRSKD